MNFTPHPEWKRLFSEIQPLLPGKERFAYSELQSLAGLDIRTSRGRQQMLRFQRAALREWGLWFECERDFGYVVTAPDEHAGCAGKRMKRGARQYKRALGIASMTSDTGASPAALAAKRQVAASCGAILLAASQEAKQIRQVQKSPAGSDPAALIARLT